MSVAERSNLVDVRPQFVEYRVRSCSKLPLCRQQRTHRLDRLKVLLQFDIEHLSNFYVIANEDIVVQVFFCVEYQMRPSSIGIAGKLSIGDIALALNRRQFRGVARRLVRVPAFVRFDQFRIDRRQRCLHTKRETQQKYQRIGQNSDSDANHTMLTHLLFSNVLENFTTLVQQLLDAVDSVCEIRRRAAQFLPLAIDVI